MAPQLLGARSLLGMGGREEGLQIPALQVGAVFWEVCVIFFKTPRILVAEMAISGSTIP